MRLSSLNIFALDYNPEIAARYHNNRHVVKMVTETAQILCTVLNQNGVEAYYNSTHINHPCTKWAGLNRTNFLWLLDLGLELSKEYTHRYGKQHKAGLVIQDCVEYASVIPNVEPLSPFALAMPESCRLNDPVLSYRNYYVQEKRHLAQWKNRPVPHWWN